MSQLKAVNFYSCLLIIAVSAISAYFWGWQSFVLQPEKTFDDRTKRCNGLTFYGEAIQKIGYPFTLAERKLDCTVPAEVSVSGYGQYSIKPLGLAADIITWIASTTVAAIIIIAPYRAYLKRQ